MALKHCSNIKLMIWRWLLDQAHRRWHQEQTSIKRLLMKPYTYTQLLCQLIKCSSMKTFTCTPLLCQLQSLLLRSGVRASWCQSFCQSLNRLSKVQIVLNRLDSSPRAHEVAQQSTLPLELVLRAKTFKRIQAKMQWLDVAQAGVDRSHSVHVSPTP
ncbi:hypothetical protein V7S43_008079 [Phytophthora oleae]|uniref:Uncharacterized protein n=1 Tax=Phytophthora oleae TaxID=2107226 RepID=A0ABD3FJQ9_9STRA